METLAHLPHPAARVREPLRLLLADGDPSLRSLIAASPGASLEEVVVLEPEDGPHAVQLGLQRHPQIALLDVDMPRLGGIEVATTLRHLQPRMRLALRTADPRAHGERARAHRLPLFHRLDRERILDWLEEQMQSCAEIPSGPQPKLRLECACGYGIVRSTPPARCPMCQAEDAWIDVTSRRLIPKWRDRRKRL